MSKVLDTDEALKLLAEHHVTLTKLDPETVDEGWWNRIILVKCKCEDSWGRYKEMQEIKICEFRRNFVETYGFDLIIRQQDLDDSTDS